MMFTTGDAPIPQYAFLLAVLAMCLRPAYAADISPSIAAAIADGVRPEADKRRDPFTKPADLLILSEVSPGGKIGDFMPGGDYFTRLFAKAVGEKGRVYAIVSEEMLRAQPASADGIKAIAADPNYSNVVLLVHPITTFKVPEKLDLVLTSDDWHALKSPVFGPADTEMMCRTVFSALKPGGLYVVIDSNAAKGAGIRDVEALGRIDPDIVKEEATKAGFELVSESNLLRNPTDDLALKVQGIMQGEADLFVLKFRKPKT
jgi:predicted methyltransferase